MPNQIAQAATSTEVAGNLRLALMRTVRRLRKETDGEHSVSVIAALGSLNSHGPLTLSELADAEGMSRPSITVLAASLVDQGLIAKEPDESDRRLVRIHLTPSGKRALDQSRTRRNVFLARRLATLSVEELRTLDRAATILVRLVVDGR